MTVTRLNNMDKHRDSKCRLASHSARVSCWTHNGRHGEISSSGTCVWSTPACTAWARRKAWRLNQGLLSKAPCHKVPQGQNGGYSFPLFWGGTTPGGAANTRLTRTWQGNNLQSDKWDLVEWKCPTLSKAKIFSKLRMTNRCKKSFIV